MQALLHKGIVARTDMIRVLGILDNIAPTTFVIDKSVKLQSIFCRHQKTKRCLTSHGIPIIVL